MGHRDHVVLLPALVSLVVSGKLYARTQLCARKICQQFALAGPDLETTLAHRKELLFLVQKNERFGRLEIRHGNLLIRPAVVNLERTAFSFNHDALVELFEKLYLAARLVAPEPLNECPSVHVDERHGNAVVFNVVEQKHDAVADFELRYFAVTQHELQLVGAERPNTVGLLGGVLGDDLSIELVKLDEVGPLQAKV